MNRALFAATLGVGGYLAYRTFKPRYNFSGKHVVITGGARGLGLVLARELASEGARLSICSRNATDLIHAVDDLTGRGAKVVAVECDVTNRDRVREFIAVARQRNGPVDVLINNAGIIQVGPLDEMREEDFEQSLQTHFWAALHSILEVVPEMKVRGTGRIVNIASIGGKIAVPHLLPYTTGKFALVGLSHGLRVELARHGIVVTTVCPGLMRTGSHLNAEFKGRHEDEYRWFAVGGSAPGFSMSAETAAGKILAACAIGDAEVVLGLPAKLGVAVQAICPNFTDSLLALVNRWILPAAGGIGTATAKGYHSRGKTPPLLTHSSDRASAANNELHSASTPSLPAN